MTYQKLLERAVENDIEVMEDCEIGRLKGLYFDNTIILSKDIKDHNEKKCILCEEIGHYYFTQGNILNQNEHLNRVQELKARRWAYKQLVKIDYLIDAFFEGIRNIYQLSNYLEVTEEFLKEAIKYYKQKYGIYHHHRNFIIRFEPFRVLERR